MGEKWSRALERFEFECNSFALNYYRWCKLFFPVNSIYIKSSFYCKFIKEPLLIEIETNISCHLFYKTQFNDAIDLRKLWGV